MRNRLFATIALLFLVLAIFVSVASAANCRVTTANDHVDQSCDAGDCSLREAVLEPSCSTIDFSLDLAGTPVVLTLGELVINHSVSITGWGADAITISGNGASRIFYIPATSTLNLSGVTLRDGNGMGTLPANGGAIRSLGPVNLDGVYLTSNLAPAFGAAISFEGPANRSMRNTSVMYNTVGSDPTNAAIYWNAGHSVMLKIHNCTIAGNTGTGVYVRASTVNIVNSTIAFNGNHGVYLNLNSFASLNNSVALNTVRDNKFGSIGSNGKNIVSTAANSWAIAYKQTDLVNVDPVLSGPQYNGGHVLNMMPLAGSPMIDGGDEAAVTSNSLTTDQRGFTRIFPGYPGGHPIVDIGSVEYNAPAPAAVTVAGRVLGMVSGNPVRSQTVAITDMLGNTRTTISSSLGWFVFDNLPAGFVYRVSVKGRRGVQLKTVFADQDLSEVDILVPGV